MALQSYNSLSVTEYDSLRYAFVKQFEESGTFTFPEAVYVDHKGIPTIGLGFNVRENLNAILDAFGFNLVDPAELQYIATIRSIVASTYPDTIPAEQALQVALDAVMANRAADANVTAPGKRSTFTFSNESEIEAVFVDEAYRVSVIRLFEGDRRETA